MNDIAPKINFPYRCDGILHGHKGAVLVVRYNNDGTYCISGGKDRCIKLWNPSRHTCIQTYDGVHGHEIYDVCITHDNAQFASCGGDRQAFVWDVTSSKVIHRTRGHTQCINAVTFNDDGQVLVTGSYDGSVGCWDCRSNMRNPIQWLKDFRDSVTSVVVRESQVFVSCVDGCIRVYDVRYGRLTTDHLCQAITCIRVSKDGNCVLASCVDGVVRLMDKGNGGLLNEYTGHTHKTVSLESCFSNDDAYVISGSESNEIFIWSLVDGALCHRIQGHSGMPVSVDYHPREVSMLSASTDQTIRVWRGSGGSTNSST